MFAGGEFYYQPEFLTEAVPLAFPGAAFLSGGAACLTIIGAALRRQGAEDILLPSYLCPNAIERLERAGLRPSFYQVQRDFSIDCQDLARQARGARALLFVNYFGFPHAQETQDLLRELQAGEILLVEDNAQAGVVPGSWADFSFNSLRKFVPVDGAYLFARAPVEDLLQPYQGLQNPRLPLIREYRRRLAERRQAGQGDTEALDALFRQAEQAYEENPAVLGDAQERAMAERLDWPRIHEARRQNYIRMMDLLEGAPRIRPIFPALPSAVMPMGLPVYIEDVSRDLVNRQLNARGIFLPVHWDDIRSDWRTCSNLTAVEMARTMLTLPVDQATTPAQQAYVAACLREAVDRLE
jgi:dTDP-4-amino-4,6-dideoxygalactose transaminase